MSLPLSIFNFHTHIIYNLVSFLFSDHQLLWQVEQINFHPDMKLTSRAKFINGGFVASMAIHADLAIATLKQEIQFKDMITSVCLPNDDSIENLKKIHGSYSGWNMNNKEIESFNVTVDTIGDAEIFEIADENENVELVAGMDGCGFFSHIDDFLLAFCFPQELAFMLK